eukprot:297230-Chlamydomonas_euryale.AAC.1
MSRGTTIVSASTLLLSDGGMPGVAAAAPLPPSDAARRIGGLGSTRCQRCAAGECRIASGDGRRRGSTVSNASQIAMSSGL